MNIEAIVQSAILIPVIGGVVFDLLCLCAVWRFKRWRQRSLVETPQFCPAVSMLKPVHGLEKGLEENLRSACTQDYSDRGGDYQVVLSVQRLDDPALPLLRELQREFGPERVSVVVRESEPVVNGKVQNLVNAMSAARHEILVISDSDVRLRPDYIRRIVSPLKDPKIGYVCTLYRAGDAHRWYERLEQLTMNVDFTISLIFSKLTGASDFCLGSSLAVRRSTLQEIGGFESLADYLVEDYELGRRIKARGYRMALVPYFVELIIDLKDPGHWWNHQLYWDQNTRAARRVGFMLTVLTRAVPFALIFAALRLFDLIGLLTLALVIFLRVEITSVMLKRLGDEETRGNLHLLPVRDVVGFVSWITVSCKRHFIWRGYRFGLTRQGRIIPRPLQDEKLTYS